MKVLFLETSAVLRLVFREPGAEEVEQRIGNAERLLASLQALEGCVARCQGRRVVARAPAAVKQQCQVWGPPGDDFALMRAIKASFDPQHRLNAGRFLGGL